MRRVLFNDQRLVLSYVQAHLDQRGRFAFFTEDVATMSRSLHMPMEAIGDIFGVLLKLGILKRVDRDWLKPKTRRAA
jgi:hypothetical protein